MFSAVSLTSRLSKAFKPLQYSQLLAATHKDQLLICSAAPLYEDCAQPFTFRRFLHRYMASSYSPATCFAVPSVCADLNDTDKMIEKKDRWRTLDQFLFNWLCAELVTVQEKLE